MRLPTADPDVTIRARGPGLVVYANTDGELWLIRGVCNACGSCDGAHPGAGPPELRLDVPVRPEGPPAWAGCSLSGRYLEPLELELEL